jgi:hypothetical protein
VRIPSAPPDPNPVSPAGSMRRMRSDESWNLPGSMSCMCLAGLLSHATGQDFPGMPLRRLVTALALTELCCYLSPGWGTVSNGYAAGDRCGPWVAGHSGLCTRTKH